MRCNLICVVLFCFVLNCMALLPTGGNKRLQGLLKPLLPGIKHAARVSVMHSHSIALYSRKEGQGWKGPGRAKGPSPAQGPWRALSFSVLAVLLAVGANFLGVTSLALSAHPEAARALQLDVLYPVQGLQRYVDEERRFSFVFPYRWVMDPQVLTRNERLRELPLPLRQARRGAYPLVAYGPRGRDGSQDFSENVSVIRSQVREAGVRGLGSAEEFARQLLDSVVAPAGSGRQTQLLSASRSEQHGLVTYRLEFCVQGTDSKGGTFSAHNLAAIAVKDDQLYSMTVTVPQDRWGADGEQARRIADSFQVL